MLGILRAAGVVARRGAARGESRRRKSTLQRVRPKCSSRQRAGIGPRPLESAASPSRAVPGAFFACASWARRKMSKSRGSSWKHRVAGSLAREENARMGRRSEPHFATPATSERLPLSYSRTRSRHAVQLNPFLTEFIGNLATLLLGSAKGLLSGKVSWVLPRAVDVFSARAWGDGHSWTKLRHIRGIG